MVDKLPAVLDTKEVDTMSSEALEVAKEIIIDDDTSYIVGADFLKGLKSIQKRINGTFDDPIKAAFAAHRSIVAAKKKHSEPIADAEKVVKVKIAAYRKEAERKRKEEEAKLRVEAKKLAEERRLAEAETLEKAGKTEEAEAVVSAPLRTPPVVLESTTPKVRGIVSREVWTFRVVNPDAIPRKYMIPDLKAIRGVAKALKGEADIPGVEVYSESSIAAK